MTVKSRVTKLTTLSTLILSTSVMAGKNYPSIYPFVPMDTEYILKSVEKMSEDKNYLNNFHQILEKGFAYQGKTFEISAGEKKEKQPWGGTYWPLNRGIIADAYNDGILGAYHPMRLFSWEHNRDRYLDRAEKIHKKIDTLTSDELEKLAPSEKYDLLLGDKSFHLTNKIWAYMQSWGSMKEYGMLHSLDKVGGKSIQRAEEMLGFGWYSDREAAINDAVQLRGGLAEKFAQELVNEGKYSSIEEALPEAIAKAEDEQHNYVLKKKNEYMATWEGICHGWATASGIVPRPRKSVTFELKDGRRLKFYPEDIKGIVSYLWANSLIQDGRWIDDQGNAHGGGILMQGLRCNEKNPKKDEWGRYYDHKPDFFSGKHEPRCVGVHPAVWHLGLVNIVGKQGRSFIVERKVKAAVDNHPLYKYEMEYFNPYNGEYTKNPTEAIMPLSEKYDQFYKFRSEETKFIVGVKTTMVYKDWQRPKRKETNSEEDDDDVEKDMLYDLELDANGNIIGGQWRTKEVGKPLPNSRARGSAVNNNERLNHQQPDFFWVVTKDWKKWFKEMQLESWTDTKSPPPASWRKAAQGAHNFIYNKTFDFGFSEKCEVVNKNNSNDVVKVPCEYKISQPQPLLNVVNKLLELSQ